MAYFPVSSADVDELRVYLHEADLTLAGLDSRAVRIWIERGANAGIVGSTGFELSADGSHALIRSVAVSKSMRAAGTGTCLARYALEEAARAGAERAWLFSRRSGPFWQKLGFAPADRDVLASVLPETQQVRLFTSRGNSDVRLPGLATSVAFHGHSSSRSNASAGVR